MFRRKIVAAALCAALAAPQISARCWSDSELSAARIRDLQTVMMVGALQCRGTTSEVLPAFNRFIKAARGTIAAQNALLRAHFQAEAGSHADAAFDQFATALANGHSQGAGNAGFCATMAATAAEAEAAGASLPALSRIAERLGDRPRGVGDSCTTSARRNPVSPAAVAPQITITTTTTTVTNLPSGYTEVEARMPTDPDRPGAGEQTASSRRPRQP